MCAHTFTETQTQALKETQTSIKIKTHLGERGALALHETSCTQPASFHQSQHLATAAVAAAVAAGGACMDACSPVVVVECG